jgi:cytidine deaminase
VSNEKKSTQGTTGIDGGHPRRTTVVFPVSTGGNVNVIVAVDYLTKWAETKALRSATARDAAEFFVEDIVLRHGAPESVVTDCGKCFVAEFTKEVMRLMEVDHRTTTLYHPQANGI